MTRSNTRCPGETEEEPHGPLLGVKDGNSQYAFMCPHRAHDGRPKSHPLGEAPRTRRMFTWAEVEGGSAH